MCEMLHCLLYLYRYLYTCSTLLCRLVVGEFWSFELSRYCQTADDVYKNSIDVIVHLCVVMACTPKALQSTLEPTNNSARGANFKIRYA